MIKKLNFNPKRRERKKWDQLCWTRRVEVREEEEERRSFVSLSMQTMRNVKYLDFFSFIQDFTKAIRFFVYATADHFSIFLIQNTFFSWITEILYNHCFDTTTRVLLPRLSSHNLEISSKINFTFSFDLPRGVGSASNKEDRCDYYRCECKN